MTKNFALTGVAGYIAPRHLRAIRDTGHRLVAAVDPHDAVGALDQFGFDVRFFREFERFDRFVDRLRRGPEEGRIQYVSVCSPNYLHDAHCRFALRSGADVICEKPLVINPWNLDALEALESEYERRIFTVLQLRVHPRLLALREQIEGQAGQRRHDVQITYVTARGPWYDVSWKGDPEKSGGVATNIGVHLFDLMLWLFGPVQALEVHLSDRRRMAGTMALANADVRWFLSVDPADLPFPVAPGARSTHRSIEVDGGEVEFTEGFADLHTEVYRRVLAGDGFGISDARPSIELTHRIRTSRVRPPGPDAHPWLRR